MSVNKVILVGNVGKEPDIKTTKNGNEVAFFSLATTEAYKDKQGIRQNKTDWHKVVVFGSLVNIVKNYIHKGSKLYVEGSLKTRKWTNNQGIEQYITEVILQGFNCTLKLLDSKDNNTNNYNKTTVETVKDSFSDASFID